MIRGNRKSREVSTSFTMSFPNEMLELQEKMII
jgi:hypothetical protein